jgi:hypothetical protein
MTSKNKVSKAKSNARPRKLDINKLDSSFETLQRTALSSKAPKSSKIIPVKPKLQPVPKQVIDQATDDISRILSNF